MFPVVIQLGKCNASVRHSKQFPTEWTVNFPRIVLTSIALNKWNLVHFTVSLLACTPEMQFLFPFLALALFLFHISFYLSFSFFLLFFFLLQAIFLNWMKCNRILVFNFSTWKWYTAGLTVIMLPFLCIRNIVFLRKEKNIALTIWSTFMQAHVCCNTVNSCKYGLYCYKFCALAKII